MNSRTIKPWQRTLYITWIAQFIAMMGMSLVVPFLPFYIRELGVSTEDEVLRWSGFVFSGPFLLSFFFIPLWGYLGDRYGRKLMAVRALFGLALAQILVGLSPNVEMLFTFRLLQGALSGFTPAAMALVAAISPREKSGYALGLLQTATASGQIIGPLIGGSLADIFNYRSIFFIVAGLCTAAGFLVIKMVHEPEETTNQANQPDRLSSNYRYAFRSAPIRGALGVIFLAQVGVAMIQPIFALYIESLVRDTTYLGTITGAAFSVAGVFMVISSPWWGKRNDAESTKRNLTLAVSGVALAYIAQGFVINTYQLIVFRALQGFCLGGVLPTLYAHISKNSDLSRRGGIMGIAASFSILASLFGPTIGGSVAASLGLRPSFFVVGGILIVTVFLIGRFFVDTGGSSTDPDEVSTSSPTIDLE